MDPILIATAGHVDHGKSTLVQCLTGVDPDRWQEEKERGITIDLGYAHLEHDGRSYSFVDVPGHEKFIHNMLAGIGSIDAVLFVIAADESIMPQTREHALALRFLGVAQVCVVLTKVDLVDDDLLELLVMEVDEWLEECGWIHAPRVHFSSKQSETRDIVLKLLATLEKKTPTEHMSFRMSIDRVFTSPGSGTVVTGTVDRGRLAREEKVKILPSGQESRIRQLQLHGQTVEEAGPHTRIAMNLGDLHYKDLGRGNGVFSQTAPDPARKLLVRLNGFHENWAPSPKHIFHLHHLAAKLQARLLWRKDNFAALELTEPYGFWALDKGLIRDGSPLQVCAGFQVLHPNLGQAKLKQVKHLLDYPAEGDALKAWQSWFLNHQGAVIDLKMVSSRCGEPLDETLVASLVPLNEGHAVTPAVWEARMQDFLTGLEACHQNMPIYEFISLNQVSSYFQEKRWPQILLDKLFSTCRDQNLIEIHHDRLKLANRKAVWSAGDKQKLAEFLVPLKGELPIIDLRLLSSRKTFSHLEGLLIWERYLVNLTPDLLIHGVFLNKIIQTLHEKYAGAVFSVADLKAAFNFTRKYAIPLLEYLDKQGCTRRHEDGRVWIAKEPMVIKCWWKSPI